MDLSPSKQIRLHDGRKLAYAEYGDSQGWPVLHFHGWPGSRLEGKFFAEEAAKRGVRMIGVDRPGIGLSDFKPGRRVLDWPADVVELADQLGLGRFAVQGWSGGGPYVLACAYKIPKHLSACGLMACVGPAHLDKQGMLLGMRITLMLGQNAPWLLAPWVWLTWGRYGSDVRRLEAALQSFTGSLPKPDQEVYARQENTRTVAESMAEAARQGVRGLAYDARLLGQPWGFELKDIKLERVHLWHGELDANVPAGMALGVAQAILQSRIKTYPGEGHLSLIINHAGEMLAELA